MLRHAGGIHGDVGDGAVLRVLVPLPRGIVPQRLARPQQFSQPRPGVLAGAPYRLLIQTQAAGLGQDAVGRFRKAVADHPQQTGGPLGAGRQAARSQAHGIVPGDLALAAAAAAVVGPPQTHGSQQTLRRQRPVALEVGGLAAVGTAHAGADVAVFF